MNYIFCILIGYLLGAFNPAYLIGKFNGFDIREKGTHNPGASNVKITLGWKYGILTAVFDIAKASFAVLLCQQLFASLAFAGMVGGVASVCGHMFPFYLRFQGGKGYASYTGMMLALNWKIALIMIFVGIVITLVTNYIALATMFTVIAYPVHFWFAHLRPDMVILLTGLAIIIIYKHRTNIINIIKGKEIGLRPKVSQR